MARLVTTAKSDLPKRRWLQIRLSTLLLVVTGMAAACGLLKWKMICKDRERAEMAEIKRLNGVVLYDWQNPWNRSSEKLPGPAWLRKLFGEDFFATVAWVNLMHQRKVTDDWLRHLEPLRDLRVLLLDYTDITDGGVQYLSRFKSLKSLTLSGTRLTDAGLAHVKRWPKLERLDIAETAVTDLGMVHLKSLTALRTLNLADTRVTDGAIRHLKLLSTLKELFVPDAVTDAGIADFQQAVPGCKVIHCVRSL